MKIKLLIINIVLLLSLTATSQVDTQPDSVVILPKWRVELIINDLYRLDYLDSINDLNELRIGLFKSQLIASDSIIYNLNAIINNHKSVSKLQTSIRAELNEQNMYWIKAYKKQKKQKLLVGGASIIFLLFLAF